MDQVKKKSDWDNMRFFFFQNRAKKEHKKLGPG